MARALFWETARPGEKLSGDGDPDDVLRILIETFGRDPEHPNCPVELWRQHMFLLRDLAHSSGSANSIYEQLAKVIDGHGKIRVWGRG